MCCFVRAQIVYHIADTWLHMAVHRCNTYLHMAVLSMGHMAVQGCVSVGNYAQPCTSLLVIDEFLMWQFCGTGMSQGCITGLCWQLEVGLPWHFFLSH